MTVPTRPRRAWADRPTALLSFAALAWTVLAGVVLLVGPDAYSVSTSSGGVDADGTRIEEVTTTTTESLLEHEGASVLIVLVVPVGIALVGALGRERSARRLRIGAGAVLLFCCLLGAASLGLFYLPAAFLLVAAGLRTERVTQQDAAIATPTA